jgi:hypothetical protein
MVFPSLFRVPKPKVSPPVASISTSSLQAHTD